MYLSLILVCLVLIEILDHFAWLLTGIILECAINVVCDTNHFRYMLLCNYEYLIGLSFRRG